MNRDQFYKKIDSFNDELINLRRHIHAHPELSGLENQTAILISGFLKNIGWNVRESIGRTGVVADFQLGNIDESEKELKKLIRRYPTFADARAALTALNWSNGEVGKAESNWIAVPELDPRYSDEEWLKKIRRWPPQPIRDLMNFIDLK